MMTREDFLDSFTHIVVEEQLKQNAISAAFRVEQNSTTVQQVELA